MAMIDYGSVVKKNGKIIQKEAFMDMKQAVDFRIKSIKQSYKEIIFEDETDEGYKFHTPKHYDYKNRIDGDYFSYMGDENLLVCVYKCGLTFISHGRIIKYIGGIDDRYELPYEKMTLDVTIKEINFHIKRLYNQNRYILRFWYKGYLYECLYGYGVDVNKDIWYDVEPNERRFIDKWFNDEKQYKYWREKNVNRN